MTYLEKLRDPRWQKKRLEIMSRDNFSCQICEDTKSTLNVHHRMYFPGKEPWEYEDWCLVTLCENCHNDECEMECVGDGLIQALKMRGYFNADISDLAISFYEGEIRRPIEVFNDFLYRLLKNESFLQKKCLNVYSVLLREKNAKIKKSNS
jgi:hypothetical protein